MGFPLNAMPEKILIPAALAATLALTPACRSSCGGERGPTTTLTLSVAASLTEAIQEVGEAFRRSHDVEIEYNFAGSGALAHQILASPRSDLYLSAGRSWMDEVETAGHLLPGSRRTLLSNRLVVVRNRASDLRLTDPAGIPALQFSYLAIGDPASVPAGRYARTWLESLPGPGGGSLWDQLDGRVSPAPDVRAALAQVEGSRDVIGIVYESDRISRPDAAETLLEVRDGPRIEFPVAILNTSRHERVAREFLEFLGGLEAAGIFERYGFQSANREDDQDARARRHPSRAAQTGRGVRSCKGSLSVRSGALPTDRDDRFLT